MEEKHVADYFVVAGLPHNPVPMEEFSWESGLKPMHRLDPIVELAVINRSLGEGPPPGFRCLDFTPTGFPADLNHGGIRAPEMYICYRRGRDKPPIVDIGVLYEAKDRVLPGCEVIYHTFQGRPANVNNTNSSRIYITFRRAEPMAACDTLAVVDVCIVLLNKGETPPHAYCMINKTLNKGMMGSDVYLCYKKAMVKTHFLIYQPAVLSRYPLEDIPGLPLPERVAMFCLPLGATVEGWLPGIKHPSPVFSTFILTAACGEKVYGAAITFYESLPAERLNETQLQQLGVDVEPSDVGESDESETKVVSRTLHQNKCVCLLSRSPFFDTFKCFLAYLCRLAMTGPHQIPLERHIVHFMTNVPIPSPQRPKILIQLNNKELSLSQPDETPLPKSGASYVEMLKNLGASNCVMLLQCTLMEQKLLIHSLRPAVLTSVAEAVANMIFPFHWQCPYIPLCPLSLSYVLNSPTPFIVGIDSRYFDLYDPPIDVTCVDLDTNSISGSDERKSQSLKMLPKKATKILKTTLERLFDSLCRDPSIYCGVSSCLDEDICQQDSSRSRRELQMELAIQEAFLRFMAVIMKGYSHYLLPITKAPTLVTTDVSSLFDIQGFLKSRDRSYHKFYVHMMKTQSFSRFIEERSFVSDKDTGLTFFDECIEKVDENRDDPRLIEPDDTLQSEMTVFVMLPEPVGLPPGVQYSYNGFPELNAELFPLVEPPSTQPSFLKPMVGSLSCPYSPMTRRTKHEIKYAQKLALKHSNMPVLWAKCLVWHCYSLWFIHLPAYIKTVHSKAKVLRIAYDVLIKMQSAKLQPPDEVCYRVLMQLCGLYHQPILAVKVLFAMKTNNVQPNAITYGFYNKAVLESKWPSSSTSAYQRWMRLRHTVLALAQFKQGLQISARRRQSVYSNSESDYDGQSVDSYLEGSGGGNGVVTAPGFWPSSIMKDSSGCSTRTKVLGHNSGAITDDATCTGLSDRGYNSLTLEEAARISVIVGSQESLTVSPKKVINHDSSSHTITAVNDGSESEDSGSANHNPNNSSAANQNSDHNPAVNENQSDQVLYVATANSTSCNESRVVVSCDVMSDASVSNLVNEDCPVAENHHRSSEVLTNGVVITSATTDLIESDERTMDENHESGAAVEEADGECDRRLVIDSDRPDEAIIVSSSVSVNDSDSRAVDSVQLNTAMSDSDVNRPDSNGPSSMMLSIGLTGSSQSLTSPVHSVRTAVTQNDPLGLFGRPGQTGGGSSAHGGDDSLRCFTGEGVYQPASSQSSSTRGIMRWSKSGSVQQSIDSSENDSCPSSPRGAGDNPLQDQRQASKCLHISKSPTNSDDKKMPSTPQRSSTQVLGTVMKSAATRFASKCREMKKNISASGSTPDGKNESLSSGSVNSLNSLSMETAMGQSSGQSGDVRSSAAQSSSAVVQQEITAVAQGQGGSDSQADNASLGSAGTNDSTAENKSRLRVPGLYTPFVSNLLVGLKSIQQSERIQSMASSLQTITASVRDTLIDSWADDWSSQTEVRDPELEYVWNIEQEDAKLAMSREESIDSGVTQNQSHTGLDHLVPVDENSEKGSMTGTVDPQPSTRISADQLRAALSSASALNQQPVVTAPMDVEICSLSKCPSCFNLLYDEEIMAGWTSDDSNLNTTCQFCSKKFVPLLQIYIKDLRHCAKPVLTNLSQSMESVVSVQSVPSIQLGESGCFRRISSNLTALTGTIPEDSVPHNECSGSDLQDGAVDSKSETPLPDCSSSTLTEDVTQRTLGCDKSTENQTTTENQTSICASDKLSVSCGTELHVDNSVQLADGYCVSVDNPLQLGDTSLNSNFKSEEAELANTRNVISNSNGQNLSTTDLTVKTQRHHLSNDKQALPGLLLDRELVKLRGSGGDKHVLDLTKRWSSSCLDAANAVGAPKDLIRTVNKADSGTGSLESRRSLSECSLTGLPEDATARRKSLHHGMHASSVGNKLDDGSSVVSTESEGGKSGTSILKKPVELDPISVPYLSPLVLRKEMENVLDLDGEPCLSRPEFVDEHPILFWNLVWYFKRISVPSHMLGFLMTASSINGNNVPSSVWGSSDSRYVAVHSTWDNPRMHNDCGQPMYFSWNHILRQQKESSSATTNGNTSEHQPEWPKSTMDAILSNIMSNNVIIPLHLILNERSKRKTSDNRQGGVPSYFSIYRDVLFLSLVALGRENIDIDAFDREFKSMVSDLPPNELARMRVADRYPNTMTCWCRKLFEELDL